MADTFARMRQIAGSTAEWTANDIVLGDGEIGVVRFGVNDVRIKIGNGTAKWSELPFAGNTVDAVDAQVSTAAQHATTATNAAASATASAAAAAVSRQFTEFYLGGKASDPTLRNNGAALQTGDLYYNTVNDRMRVYETGTGWIDYEATAQTAATTATTQAATATSQAGIATTQAGIATTHATNANTARTAAEAARDAAFINANVYASTAAGLAAVADGQQFQVVSGDQVIRYRRDNATTATEVARYATAANVIVSRPLINPIMSEATLLRDLGNPSLVLTGSRDVIAITDTELNLFGYTYANRMDNLAALEENYFAISVPDSERGWGLGDYVAASVFVKTADWAGLDASRLCVFTFNRTGGFQASYVFNQYDEIRADLRRYHGVMKLTNVNVTDISVLWLEVTSAATKTVPLYITGVMVGLSEGQPGGLDWRNAPKRILDNEGLTSAAERGAFLKTMVPNGAMLNGGEQGVVRGAGVSVVAVTDTELNKIGITHAMSLANTANVQDSYGKLVADACYYGVGDWLAYSFFIKTADWAGLDVSRLRALCLPMTGGGAQTNIMINSLGYEIFRSDLRRYYGVLKIPAGITDINQVWIEVTASAGRSAPLYVTGHAAALSRFRPIGVDWSDFDPYAEENHETRIDTIEAELNLATPQSVAGFLVPSSYHMVQGRPLKLYRHGLTEYGRGNRFDIVFKGKSSGNIPFVGYVEKAIDLDGNRLSGAGHVYSRPANGATSIWRRPVTFYSSAPTKTGSPKILVIGDSLTQEGTVTKLKDKLVTAGVTPTFLGTVVDDGGTLCEGRPSWEFSDFTRKYLFIDVANPIAGGTTPTYPIDATANGDGVVTTVASYLALGNSGNYGPRWKYNPFIRPTQAGDNAAFVKNGYIFDLDFYLTRFSFADPDIVLIALGTNDFTSNNNATSAANVAEGLNIMVTQIAAAAPAAKIAICFKDIGTGPNVAIKAAIDTYADREAEGIFLLPIYSVLDEFAIYDAARNVTVNSTDVYGVQNISITDSIHPGDVGKEQWAEMTFAFVMNRI